LGADLRSNRLRHSTQSLQYSERSTRSSAIAHTTDQCHRDLATIIRCRLLRRGVLLRAHHIKSDLQEL
jgi:hypothetical protein